MKMLGVTEYAEGMTVELTKTTGGYISPDNKNSGAGRWVVLAKNEGGCNCTEVDVIEMVDWLWKNRPDLMVIHGVIHNEQEQKL